VNTGIHSGCREKEERKKGGKWDRGKREEKENKQG